MKGIRVELINYGTSNTERPSNPSRNDSYCTTIERLPSWREFAEDMLIFPQPRRYNISMSLEGSNYEKRHPSIIQEFPNLNFRNHSYFSSPPSTSTQEVSSQFHTLTSLISLRRVVPLFVEVADLTNIPHKLPLSYKMVRKCHICGRGISRGTARHLRTHNQEARFKCFYPRACCSHKNGFFHRKYEFKKHLLHRHFILHVAVMKRLKNLTDKLEHEGTCPCGKRMKAREWLIHIIARDSDGNLKCEDLRKKTAENTEFNIGTRI